MMPRHIAGHGLSCPSEFQTEPDVAHLDVTVYAEGVRPLDIFVIDAREDIGRQRHVEAGPPGIAPDVRRALAVAEGEGKIGVFEIHRRRSRIRSKLLARAGD